MISEAQVEDYQRDGVVLLRGHLVDWVDDLRRGVAAQLARPSPRHRLWNRAEDGSTTRYDSQAWQEIPEYRSFVHESPLAEIAGRLMRSTAVNFFFDAIFVRTAGAQFRTPFHQDEPYWSVQGFDTCSAWMPLVPVERASTLEFVAGSHRWNRRFAQQNFGALTGDERDQVDYAGGWEPFPDIEGDRDSYDIRGWAMQPGDVAIFNARLIHGGSGRLAADRDLQVFNTQWLGDDVRVHFRPEGMDPDHSEVMTAAGLAPGDRVDSELYPRIWSAATAG